MKLRMEYNTIFAKSFSRYEQKKLGYGAMLISFIVTLSFFSVCKPSLAPLPTSNIRLSRHASQTMLMIEHTNSSQPLGTIVNKTKQETKLVCNIIDPRSDFCEISGDVRIHGNSSTIFFASSIEMWNFMGNESWKIKPYTRKGDEAAMGSVNELSVKSFLDRKEGALHCTSNHSVPAIVFSSGGYSGNHFHDFADILVPLFLTSYQFHGEVQFLITNFRSFWISKYQAILKQLSKYEIMKIDRDDEIHCFPSVIVGLKYHKHLSIDPSKSPKGYSMKDFTQFLRNSYSLKRKTAIRIGDCKHKKKKPRLLIISRKKTRSFTNEGEIAKMAKSLGYEVVVLEPKINTNLSRVAQIVNSCDVMMGVHGAGLTNLVFLPTNAILIQIAPLGGMEWLCRTYFGEPALDMKIRYLEYKIKEEESSLIQQYPLDHAVIKDPFSIGKQGWGAFKAVYLDKQNVKLDIDRFRTTLLQALELLHH